MEYKTMKISELVKVLNRLKGTFGDLPVYMSSDSEGNSFGTLHYDDNAVSSIGVDDDRFVMLYPWEERDMTELYEEDEV